MTPDRGTPPSPPSTATQPEISADFDKVFVLRAKTYTEPQSALHHAPTGSWRLLTAIGKGEPDFEVLKNVYLWPLEKRLCGEGGSAGLMAALCELRGLFQP